MSSENRPYPLSSSKRDRLRAQGIFPQSDLLVEALRLCGFLLVLAFMLPPMLQGLLNFATKAFANSNLRQDLWSVDFLGFGVQISQALLVLIGLRFLIGLLQSRFLIDFRLLGVNFGRLLQGFRGSFRRGLNAMLSTVIACLALCLAFYYLASRSKQLAEEALTSANLLTTSALFNKFLWTAGGLCCIAVVLGIFGYALRRVLFFKAHAMTREEVESERREEEMSDLMRSSVRERSQINK